MYVRAERFAGFILSLWMAVMAAVSVAGGAEDRCLVLGESGSAVTGQGGTPHVKWSQPPVEIDPNVDAPPVFCGWGEAALSAQSSGLRRQWRMDADDFRCLGPIPITRIRWWGSYKAWDEPEPPANQPESWHIGFWANQVQGISPEQSYPERLVWSVEAPPERLRLEPVGMEQFPGAFPAMCFACELALEPEEWFRQGEFESNGGVFWISITAVYPVDAKPINQWGWTTRPYVWRDGAVMPAIMGEWPTPEERLFPGRIFSIERPSLCEGDGPQPYDLCFELLTEEPWGKHDQPLVPIRQWPQAADRESMAFEDEEGNVSISRQTADDWPCDGNAPVFAVAWWGSYLGYGCEACKCEEQPEPPRPDCFLLTISTSVGPDRQADYARPDEAIWQYRAYDYDEVLVGYDRNPAGEPNEPVYRYSVRLPETNWFHPGPAGSVYWFSVTAIHTDPMPTIAHPWGWTNHPHTFGAGATFIDYCLITEPQWRPLRDPADQPLGMSFTLFTRAQ